VQASEQSPIDTGVRRRVESLREGSESEEAREEGGEEKGGEEKGGEEKGGEEKGGEEKGGEEKGGEEKGGEEMDESAVLVEARESASERVMEEGETCHDPEHQPGGPPEPQPEPSTTQKTETCHDPEHQSIGPETLHDSATGIEAAAEPEDAPVPATTEEIEEHHDPEHQPGEPGPLHESETGGTEIAAELEHHSDPETTSFPSHTRMPVLTAIGQAIGLLSSSSGKQSEEPSAEPAEKAVGRAAETPAQPDLETLSPLPASPMPKPTQSSSSEEPASITPLAHLMSSEASMTSAQPEDMPRPFPVFRQLPTEPAAAPVGAPPRTDHQQPMSPPGVAAPLDVNRLPRPRILVIRATNDSMADPPGSSFTPGSWDDSDNRLESAETTMPKAAVQGSLPPSASLSPSNLPGAPGVPEVPLPTSDLFPEDPGVGNVPAPALPPRKRKGKRLIRKTRRVVLRSPVLTIILGKQLALLTRPAIKIIAEGGELPPMSVVGETVGTVAAPLGAVEAVGAATA